jgi:hypothetical protein
VSASPICIRPSWGTDGRASDELERTTGYEQHSISSGDLNSDCLQRLITVHTIVSLQLFSTRLCSGRHTRLCLLHLFSPLHSPLFFLCSRCKNVDAVKHVYCPSNASEGRGGDLGVTSHNPLSITDQCGKSQPRLREKGGTTLCARRINSLFLLPAAPNALPPTPPSLLPSPRGQRAS